MVHKNKKPLKVLSISIALVLVPIVLLATSRNQPSTHPPSPKIPAADSPASNLPAQDRATAQPPDPTTDNTSHSVDGSGRSTKAVRSISQADKKITNGALKQAGRIITKDGQSFPLRQYKTLTSPNDPLANQWWEAPNGMSQVWGIPYGARSSKIAIIDTGFGLQHEDLRQRWATNSGESGPTSSEGPSQLNCSDRSLPLDKSCNNIDDNFDSIVDNESGPTSRQNPSFLNCTDQSIALDKSCNRLDDDNNGLVDDIRGWDFSNYDSSVQAGQTNPDGSGTDHGTMTAGVLAASGNNGLGIAGVDWYSQILPIQALDDDGYGDSYTVAEAIYYAADQGADVISISLGTTGTDPYLRLAIQYAMEKGAIVVAASGNDGCNCISYPANYPEVLAVGAIDSSGQPASFSSFGSNLDLLAPGASITTSYWTKTNQTSAYASGAAGTSFAAPFVSGLLGLGKSYQPTAAWEEIIGAMLENSDRRTLTSASPRSDQLGYGVSRANTMLGRLNTPAEPALRYQLGGVFSLGSQRAYKCENTLPATPLYELTKSSALRYSSSQLENYKATQQGWALRQVFTSCIGLPTDKPKILRTINLPAEIRNSQNKS